MAGDFNKPVVTDAYASVLQSIKDLISDLAKGLDGTSTANIPTNAIRWSSTNNRFEKYNGSTWGALATQYAIDVATVAGKSVGNANGNIPLSNGTLNTNLNAQLFNGLQSNVFSKSASNLDNSVIAADTRSSNHAPQDRSRGAYFDFRANSTDGLTDGGTYHGVMSFRTYGSGADFSGGNAHQLGFTDNGNLWYRAGSGASWGSWTKFLTDANFNATIGAGARNAQAAGTYGGMNITGANGGWAGFQFNSTSRYFMSNYGQTGEYDTSSGTWQWRWDSGTLAVGTVPWARLSGVPAMSFLALTGGGLTGPVSTAGNTQPFNSANDQTISVRSSGTGTAAVMSFHRPGAYAINMGLDTDNIFKIGGGSADSPVFQLNMSGQLWTSNYGWLHDYFAPYSTNKRIWCNAPNSGQYGWAWVDASGRIGRTEVGNGYIEVIVDNVAYAITITPSDARFKTVLGPTNDDSLDKISKIDFVNFTYNENLKAREGEHWSCGIIAQQLEIIDVEWVKTTTGDSKMPSTDRLLIQALHAIKQLKEIVDIQQQKLENFSQRLSNT